MSETEQQLRGILEHNTGFIEPARWVDYARRHDFTAVRAVKVPRCPDCSGAALERTWGQYVYYSTLIRLLECASCGLIWADARLDPDVVRQHFETTYKDDTYFRISRHAIFEHLAAVVDRVSPRGARILDIGGARGDLMGLVVARRPDVDVTLNDISNAATDYAAQRFGFATLTGDANELARHQGEYDVVVLSDVLYYEPNLRGLWVTLSRLIRPGGAILRASNNKHVPIRMGQSWYRLTHTRAGQDMQDRVSFFNPEHIFIFRPRYLRRRLLKMGFGHVQALSSPPLVTAKGARLGRAFFRFASRINQLSRQNLVLTPAMIMVGTVFERDGARVSASGS